jgi:hypothetical protein
MYVCIVRCTVACRTVAWLGRLCADFVLSDAPVLIFSKPECENFGYVKAHTIPMHSAAADSVALPGRDVMCPSGAMSCAPWHSVSAVASIVERFRTPSAILRRSRRPSAAELYCAILLCAIHPKRCPLKTLGSARRLTELHSFALSALMLRTASNERRGLPCERPQLCTAQQYRQYASMRAPHCTAGRLHDAHARIHAYVRLQL